MHEYRIQATDIHAKFQGVGSDDSEQVSGEGFRFDSAAILNRRTMSKATRFRETGKGTSCEYPPRYAMTCCKISVLPSALSSWRRVFITNSHILRIWITNFIGFTSVASCFQERRTLQNTIVLTPRFIKYRMRAVV